MLEHLELKLLAGYPIEIESGEIECPNKIGNIYQPKIKDIIDIEEDKYNQYIGLLLFDTDLIDIDDVYLHEIGLNKITTFEFLLIQSMIDNEFKMLTEEALAFFLKENVSLLINLGLFCVGDMSEGRFIDTNIYDYIRKVLIKTNYLKELEEEENLQFGNEMAREWYLEMKRAEQNRPKPKPKVNLHSIISAMMWRTNKSIDEILDMTIYQLYDGYYRLFLIDDSLGIKDGIYHGMIDSKAIKPDDLNWARIIKFEEN